MTVIWAFLSFALAVLIAVLGELVSDEIRGRLDCVPFALLAAAARRLPKDQRIGLYEQAWLPELHYLLRGDQAKPLTRLVHGSWFAAGLWLAAHRISREFMDVPRRQDTDLVVGVDSALDLLSLAPVEFERLIRQLFEVIGFRWWMTQASPDAGINGLGYSDDPLLGGLCLVQAKRYSRIVGVTTVRELVGAVEQQGAIKGILVTTSWVSKASRDLAARHGRIEIIDGGRLKSLLAEHLGIEVGLPSPRNNDLL